MHTCTDYGKNNGEIRVGITHKNNSKRVITNLGKGMRAQN